MKSVMVNIAVMDYCSGSIKMYSTSFPTGWQTEDVEKWLCDNTDYKDSQCYFMCSEDEIEIEYPDFSEEEL